MQTSTHAAPAPASAERAARVETVDARALLLMRCVLAFLALVVIWIDPSERARLTALTYASLALYCLYSVVLALVSYRANWPAPGRALHWVDVFCFGYLLALTGGTNGILFQFFVFAILVASVSRGFGEGLAVTLASLVLLLVAELMFAPAGAKFGFDRTLIRPAYLFVFGCMIAYWGGNQILLRRRRKLLQEISSLWHPRFGVDHAIGSDLERLLDFYGGSSCVLVLQRPSVPPGGLMYSAVPAKPGHAATPGAISASAAESMLQLPPTIAAFYHDPAASWGRKFRGHAAYDLRAERRVHGWREACEALASLLDAPAFATVPYVQRDGTAGRIFLASNSCAFTHSDIDFLAQASSAMSTIVENMVLTEQLTSRASEYERLRISRDLHDTTIQPYIGLKLALDALQRDAGADNPLSPRIAELVDMAGMTIRDLRDYTATLKGQSSTTGEFLIGAVQEQADRLGRFYGIEVEVRSDITTQLNGRMAAEAFQVISEGLSNILRHTESKRAFVSIMCDHTHLQLQIGNEAGGNPGAADSFTPRSIHERAQALGGNAFVERGVEGYTVVKITIPL